MSSIHHLTNLQQQPSNLSIQQDHSHHSEDHHHHHHHHHHHQMATGFISFPNSSSSTTTTTTNLNPNFPEPIQSTHLLKPMISDNDHQTLITPHVLSLHNRSSLWAWGDLNNESFANNRRSLLGFIPGGDRNLHQKIHSCGGGGGGQLGVSAVVKMKKMNSHNNKLRKKVREPRFSFKTLSDVDVLDDGYKWRKYGQKVVKNTHHPRSYYRCTKENCRVKKRVERLAEDPRMVITTYEGRHAHSPSQDTDDDSQPDHLNTSFFW